MLALRTGDPAGAATGTVRVTVEPGSRGPTAWYWITEGDTTTQEPGTAGFRVGSGLSRRELGGEPHRDGRAGGDAGPVGVTEVTLSGGGGAVGLSSAATPEVAHEEGATGDEHQDESEVRVIQRRWWACARVLRP